MHAVRNQKLQLKDDGGVLPPNYKILPAIRPAMPRRVDPAAEAMSRNPNLSPPIHLMREQ